MARIRWNQLQRRKSQVAWVSCLFFVVRWGVQCLSFPLESGLVHDIDAHAEWLLVYAHAQMLLQPYHAKDMKTLSALA